MPSPFPGMNPYLEQNDAWEDFHQNYITHAQEALAAEVGVNYVVKIETRLYVHELAAADRKFTARADVSLSMVEPRQSDARSAVAVATAPVELPLSAVDIERYSWLEIRDRRDRRVVTAIELLSPTNKTPGPDRDDYLTKRAMLLLGPAHFIEIDLRRGGTRPAPPPLPPCAYYVALRRARGNGNLGVWPLSLKDRLPLIPVPLKAPDPDVVLDLQAVLDHAYDAARYGNYIYSDSPEPPLSAEEGAWAQQYLPSAATLAPKP